MPMRSLNVTVAVAALTAGLLAACEAPIETQPASATLAPMPKPPDPKAGDIVVGERNGERTTIEVVSLDGSVMTATDSRGCTYKRDLQYSMFSPAIAWNANCSSSAGQVEIHSMKGEIWPLQVGKTWSYDADGQTSSQWTSDMTCSVKDTAFISVPAGSFDTYHVACSTKWYTKDFYVAPEAEIAVLVQQRPRGNSNASNYTWKLVEKNPGAAS
jgi:hypothetical protein